MFWVGYHFNPYLRAFGFGVTFYPTVVVYLWLVLRMVFGIQIQI
jgi:urea transporter